jgi:metal-dependent amidase/aminoacylase/carboxypeptidase family protein
MASLIAALRHAAKHRQDLKRNLVFCFQPGEEGKGGASKLFKAKPDLLEGIKECYAIHFYNGMYPGTIALGKGTITAHSSRLLIDIEGKSTHCMGPHVGIDANYIGCVLVGQLYSLISLKVPPLNGATLVVFKVSGGGEAIRVSNRFELAASIRVTSTLDFQKLEKTITDLTNSLCSAYGAKANIRFITGNQ